MQMLILYISESDRFDLESVKAIFNSEDAVVEIREDDLIGSVLEADLCIDGECTIVRLNNDLKTITISGITDVSLKAALLIQRRYPTPLHAIDLDYSFDLLLSQITTSEELRARMLNPE